MTDDLYVMQCVTAHIKVGRSRDAWHRLQQINDTSPFETFLVAVVTGAGDQESALHAALRPFWWRGEWFVGSSFCRETIARCLGIAIRWPISLACGMAANHHKPRVNATRAQMNLHNRSVRLMDEAFGFAPEQARNRRTLSFPVLPQPPGKQGNGGS
jgi:T5orf172 domain